MVADVVHVQLLFFGGGFYQQLVSRALALLGYFGGLPNVQRRGRWFNPAHRHQHCPAIGRLYLGFVFVLYLAVRDFLCGSAEVKPEKIPHTLNKRPVNLIRQTLQRFDIELKA